MKSGTRPHKIDHRDFDFHKSFGTVGVNTNTLPTGLNLDAGLWMPSQETQNVTPNFIVYPLPYGCTDYTQTDLCIDEDDILESPLLLEAADHANVMNGLPIITAIKAAMPVFNRIAYFNVKTQYPLDWFDAFRVCMASTEEEKRSISVGTPYFNEWALTPSTGIMPMPKSLDTSNLPWHNWKICGWKQINGVPYLLGKTWQGQDFGDNGWGYVSRELCNTMMSVNGVVAYTMSKVVPANVQVIDVTWVEFIVSLIRNLL